MLKQLEPFTVDSEYIETDSNHVAFHMVKPVIVIELMINDVLFETGTGPVRNARNHCSAKSLFQMMKNRFSGCIKKVFRRTLKKAG